MTKEWASQAASALLRRAGDNQVVVGPLCWQSDGSGGKVWYFIVGVCEKGRGFRCDEIRVDAFDTDLERAVCRAEVIQAMARPRFVIHVMEDELSMVRLCEGLWPGKHITQLRRAIESESGAK